MPVSQSTHTNSSIVQVNNFQATAQFHTVPTVGGFLQTYNITPGILLEETLIETAPGIATSKRVPLIDGSTIALVNGTTFGELTIRVSRTANSDITTGTIDVGIFALLLQKTPGLPPVDFLFSFSVAGPSGTVVTQAWTFYSITLIKAPPLGLMGNDVYKYSIQFSYDDFSMN
jgi:hypothetical protein